ncbi:protein D2-like [Arctopsyche grandis]|uniref:protein D2-like n=1 Tax=Arctopsyche grandis TaxID=121162 RepID=UPI00406D8949
MTSKYHTTFFVLAALIVAVSCKESCDKLDGKKLLEGCSLLKGLSIISKGGTLVNESNCDVLLPKLIFAKEPKVTFDSAKADKFYTVLAIDPDAPNHSPGNYFLHMIKSNVPGSSLLEGDITTGVDVTKYRGPGPPKGTGDHRYLFVVYEQKSGDLKLEASEVRARFNPSDWMKDLPLCGPVAGVQFRARFEL